MGLIDYWPSRTGRSAVVPTGLSSMRRRGMCRSTSFMCFADHHENFQTWETITWRRRSSSQARTRTARHAWSVARFSHMSVVTYTTTSLTIAIMWLVLIAVPRVVTSGSQQGSQQVIPPSCHHNSTSSGSTLPTILSHDFTSRLPAIRSTTHG